MRFDVSEISPQFGGLSEQLTHINFLLATQERWVVQVLNVAEVSMVMANALEGVDSPASPAWNSENRRLMAAIARFLSAAGKSVGTIVESLAELQNEYFEASGHTALPFPPSVLSAAAVAADSYYHGMAVKGKVVEMVGRADDSNMASMQRSLDRFIRSLN